MAKTKTGTIINVVLNKAIAKNLQIGIQSSQAAKIAMASWVFLAPLKVEELNSKGKPTGKLISPVDSVQVEWRYWANQITYRKDGTTVATAYEQAANRTTHTIKTWATTQADTYEIPSQAIKIGVRVKPISKTVTIKNGNKSTKHKYIQADWSSVVTMTIDEVEDGRPEAPTVNVANQMLTASLSNIPSREVGGHVYEVEKVRFGIFTEDVKPVYTQDVDVPVSKTVSISYPLTAGHSYTVRAQYWWTGGPDWSAWSQSTAAEVTIPSSPTVFTKLKAYSSTSIEVSWDAVEGATSYELEYVTSRDLFNKTDENKITTENTAAIVTGLETGNTYYFRIRTLKDSYNSAWYPSDPYDKSVENYVVLGREPAAPSTYSLRSTISVGDVARLYWVHNAQDNSTQIGGMVHLMFTGLSGDPVDGYVYVHNDNYEDEFHQDDNLYLEIDTSDDFTVYPTEADAESETDGEDVSFSDGVTIEWQVKTKGVTEVYGGYSVVRKVEVYSNPVVTLEVSSETLGWAWDTFNFQNDSIYTAIREPGEMTYDIDKLPIDVRITSGPQNQNVISYNLEIAAVNDYTYVNQFGESTRVLTGQVIYSRYIPAPLDDPYVTQQRIEATDVDFQNGESYIMTATVTMGTGLSAMASFQFNIDWDLPDYNLGYNISFNEDKLTTYIVPFCLDGGVDPHPEIDEMDDDGSIEYELVENVRLSVYRANVNGDFTLIGEHLENDGVRGVVDPHPTLGYVVYRIVAHDILTGSIISIDTNPYEITQPGVVVTWDERWNDQPFTYLFGDSADEDMNAYSGIELHLPFNVDVNEQYDIDSASIKYIGREHPVAYYGTQLGQTYSLRTEIPRDQEEAIEYDVEEIVRLLRRLSVYTGDVYVRESQSRLGFWANVKVSFDINHNTQLIPVTLTVTRVEGGV